MFNIGMPELLVILIVVLIVVGPKKLPDMARTIGKALLMFKKATVDIKDALEQEPPQEMKEEVEEKIGSPEKNKDKTA